MAANVEYDFKNHFEIDEEKIRRIHSIIKARVTPETVSKIGFTITRADNLIYLTFEVNDVINEANDSISKITNLEINSKDDALNLSVIFNEKSGASIKVIGDDRDNVFLLSSELKEYISKEVTTLKKWFIFNSKIMMSTMLLSFLAFFCYQITDVASINEESIKPLLAGADINEKLNFLIERQYRSSGISSTTIVPMFLFTGLFVALTTFPMTKLMDFIYPRNIFMLGKQISIIEKKRKLKSNIFWVIIVGGILSFTLTYFSSKFFG